MNIFKNYKFYLIIAYTLLLIIYNICNHFNLTADYALIADIIAYIISGLIAYNVITIGVKAKTKDDIVDDLNMVNEKIASIKDKMQSTKKLQDNSRDNDSDIKQNCLEVKLTLEENCKNANQDIEKQDTNNIENIAK